MTLHLDGKVFGRLYVVEKVPKWNLPEEFKNQTGHYYKCNCSCGNEVIVSSHELHRGGVKSCGCLRKENAKKNIKNYREEVKKALELYRMKEDKNSTVELDA